MTRRARGVSGYPKWVPAARSASVFWQAELVIAPRGNAGEDVLEIGGDSACDARDQAEYSLFASFSELKTIMNITCS